MRGYKFIWVLQRASIISVTKVCKGDVHHEKERKQNNRPEVINKERVEKHTVGCVGCLHAMLLSHIMPLVSIDRE